MPNSGQTRRQPQHYGSEMTSQIGVHPAQRRGVGGEPSRDAEACNASHPCLHTRYGGSGLYCPSATDEAAYIPAGRSRNHCRKSSRTVKTGGVINGAVDIILQMQRIAPDERTGAANLPHLAKQTAGETLSPRPPAQHDNLAAKKPGAGRQVDGRFAA